MGYRNGRNAPRSSSGSRDFDAVSTRDELEYHQDYCERFAEVPFTTEALLAMY